MRWAIDLFGKLLAPTAKKFHLALMEPQATQRKIQEQIFNSLTASEYGRALGIKSLSEWERIPIVEYQDIEPWIERQKRTNSPLLTKEPVVFYERTSGSRDLAKWIPYTRSLRQSFSAMFCVWAYDLIQNGPAFSTGKVYFCVSPQLTRSQTAGSVPTGLADDSEYLDGWLRWILRPFLVSPPGINRLPAAEFKHKLCLALLAEETLETISIWSPSFLTVHLDYMQSHSQQLREELSGKISTERLQLLSEPEIPWVKIWPQLKLISCWDSAYAADRASSLRSLFPGVLVQGKGLLATEAPMTVPLIAAQGCVPVLDRVFFEFEDRSQRILKLHELKEGEVYTAIVSQMGGLYRYRIGDRVRVSHFYLGTPCLEFVGRDRAIVDLVGEKLHGEFVRDVISSLAIEGSSFQSLAPTRHPTDRYVLLLDRANLPASAIALRLDEALCQSPQYCHARLLGQLATVEVLVSKRIPEAILLAGDRSQTQSHARWGDIKHQILSPTPIDADLLTNLQIVVAQC